MGKQCLLSTYISHHTKKNTHQWSNRLTNHMLSQEIGKILSYITSNVAASSYYLPQKLESRVISSFSSVGWF